ncbi:MAG: signal recognition particle-docking protein FtsY [Anaerolineales bacterium]|nr:signal recognition particle-docking protein FtsY [Anaerolineales bacterium]
MIPNSWQDALERTRKTTFGRVATLLGQTDLTDSFWDELEAELILADLGLKTTQSILAPLQQEARAQGWTRGAELRSALRNLLIGMLEEGKPLDFSTQPVVIMLVGVNGSGKTTSLAKLGYRLQQDGRSILIAAADTYRAAATDQLQRWAERLKTQVITGLAGSDPGAVVYDACQAAQARGVEALLIDTSGRMHTEHNLMSELQKITRVAGKVISGAPHRVYLVLDATTGQNGLSQAQVFMQTIHIDGIILTKLDGSAKGGVAVAIQQQLGIPIDYVGLGEGLGAFSRFDARSYVDGLIGPTSGG